MAEQNLSSAEPLAKLLQLARRARHANDASELAFALVNETFQLAQYRQAALWIRGEGIRALSGVSAPEQNAPFVQWLNQLVSTFEERSKQDPKRGPIGMTAQDVPAALAAGWSEWLPANVLWLPLGIGATDSGALLLARDDGWLAEEIGLLMEWVDTWLHAWQLKHRSSSDRKLTSVFASLTSPVFWHHAPSRLIAAFAPGRLTHTMVDLWRIPIRRYAVLVCLVLLIPVRLTVLAPGELVPVNPAVVRAPLDGVVERVLVQPNQRVRAHEALFTLDRSALQAHLEVAEQALLTAEAEYRQQAQLAVFDARGKSRLADLQGAIAERQAEADYLKQQLERSTITAARAGIVLFDDPSEWIGRPVVTGERIATVADERDVEVEAWLAPGDLIALPRNPDVTLYLNTTPLSPVRAKLRYVLYEATQRPDGNFAYRVRATLDEGERSQRVGLKGTAKVSGYRVPLVYWMLRRPLSAARQLVGL